MKEIALGVLAALMFSPAAWAADEGEALEFKGIFLGTEYRSIKERQASRFSCGENKLPFGGHLLGDQWCNLQSDQKETIAGVPVQSMRLFFYDEMLHEINITIESRDWLVVSGALRGKYGDPRMRQEAIQTRTGAVYENVELDWKKERGVIEARLYAGDIRTSSIKLRTHQRNQLFQDRTLRDAKQRSKDI